MIAILFAVTLGTMICSHMVADHVLQTDHQAVNKGKAGWLGWSNILLHVADYHLAMLIMLMVTYNVLDLSPNFWALLAGLGFSFITHAIIDRRWPVRKILEHTGSPEFAKMTQPLHGMYLADQGLHYFCLWVSALLVAWLTALL